MEFSLADTLMAALAMFQFKSPSLLKSDEHTRGPESATLLDNLRRLYRVRFVNDLPLNAAHRDVSVNLLEFCEVRPAIERVPEKTSTWAWITSLEITEENALEIARTARTRWGVENQTVNCLKNQGYRLGRSCGHGQEHRSSPLAGLMLLSFLFDQVQEHACAVFRAARRVAGRKDEPWSSMRTYLRDVSIGSRELLFGTIGRLGPTLQISDVPDTG